MTLAGQAVMEGLLGMKVNIWLTRIVTRFINVIPTTIALLLGFDPLSILVYSQVLLSLMIPLPMIPLVLLTRNNGIMGEFVNRNITTIISIVFVGIILAFNSHKASRVIGSGSFFWGSSKFGVVVLDSLLLHRCFVILYILL